MKGSLQHKAKPVLIGALLVLSWLLLTTPKLTNRLPKGKQKIAKIQIKELEGALQLFYYDAGRYPTMEEGWDALVRNPGLARWKGPYMPKQSIQKDPWGRSYVYRCPGERGLYDVLSYGADRLPGGDGINADVTSRDEPVGR